MGIGRREFLKLFSSTIAVQGTGLVDAVSILENQYVNRAFGIALQKPPGWNFLNVQEMGQIKNGQILNFEDVKRAQKIKDFIDLPILKISKESNLKNHESFSPSITVFVEPLSEAESETSSNQIIEILESDIEFCQSTLKNFYTNGQLNAKTISRNHAGSYLADFIFEHEKIKPIKTRMQSIVIIQERTLYTFRMFDSPFAENKLLFNFNTFIQSIRLV